MSKKGTNVITNIEDSKLTSVYRNQEFRKTLTSTPMMFPKGHIG